MSPKPTLFSLEEFSGECVGNEIFIAFSIPARGASLVEWPGNATVTTDWASGLAMPPAPSLNGHGGGKSRGKDSGSKWFYPETFGL